MIQYKVTASSREPRAQYVLLPQLLKKPLTFSGSNAPWVSLREDLVYGGRRRDHNNANKLRRIGLVERKEPVRFLIRDRDRRFTTSFDAVFEAQHVRVARTPVQAPEANGIAERFVRTVRSECLDWLLIGGARHLERALAEFIEHYNSHRAHRSLDLAPPNGRPAIERCREARPIRMKRRDRLGGLIHEYQRAA